MVIRVQVGQKHLRHSRCNLAMVGADIASVKAQALQQVRKILLSAMQAL